MKLSRLWGTIAIAMLLSTGCAGPALAAPSLAGTPTPAGGVGTHAVVPGPIGTPTVMAAALADCGEDAGCLSQAAAACTPSQAVLSLSIDLFGLITSASTRYEIRGMQNGRCVFYQRTVEAHVQLSDAATEEMRAQGTSDEDIAAATQQANDRAQTTVGLARTCRFNPADLAGMLSRWAAGSFSSDDTNNAECTPLVEE